MKSAGTIKILKRVVFGSYLKTTRAINIKFCYILEERMLNPSTMSKKMYLIIVQS